jgi:hypothetical protein
MSVVESALQSSSQNSSFCTASVLYRLSIVEGTSTGLSNRMLAAESLTSGSSTLVTAVLGLQAANSSQQSGILLSTTVTQLSAQVGTLQAASSSQAVQFAALNNSVQASLSLVSSQLNVQGAQMTALSSQLAVHTTQIAALQASNASVQLNAVTLTERVSSVEISLSSVSAATESLLVLSSPNATVQAAQELTQRVTSLESGVSVLTARISTVEVAISNIGIAAQSPQSSTGSGPSLASIYSVQAFPVGSTAASISWTVVSFTVQATPGGLQCTTTTSSCIIDGLTSGVPYKFNVTATNLAGIGPTSTYSNIVTPALLCFPVRLLTVGPGTVTVSPNSTNCADPQSYPVASTVTLTAIPSAGYAVSAPAFTGSMSNSNPFSFKMPSSVVMEYVYFLCIALPVSSNSPATGAVTANPTSSSACPDGFYTDGAAVTLTAVSSAGYPFAFWNGSVSLTTGNTLAVIVGSVPLSVSANFLCIPLTILSSNITRGSVSSTPSSSGGCAAGSYAAGSVVTLSATTTANYVLGSWSGTQGSFLSSFTLTIGITSASAIASFVLPGMAAVVYGQGGDFTKGAISSPSSSHMGEPVSVALDVNSNLYGMLEFTQ